MKIAEALALRADLQRRLEQLKQRLVKNARVQEGDHPAEAPDELQVEFEHCARELMSLVQKINRTNASSRLGSGTLAGVADEGGFGDIVSLLVWRSAGFRRQAC